MRVSGAQLQAAGLVESHKIGVTVNLVNRAGTVLAGGIPVGEDISLTLDATAAVRRHVSFSVVDPTAFMHNGVADIRGSDLDPANVNLLDVYATMTPPPGGGGVTFQVGRFVIGEPRLDDPGLGLTLDGYDLASLVSAYKLTAPYGVIAGTNVATAIADLIDYAVPAPVLPKSFASTSATLPAGIVLNEGDDPMAIGMKWAADAGFDLFFDYAGTLVFRPTVTPYSASPAWVYFEGEDAVMVGLEQTFSVFDSFSHVIALGQTPNGSAPIRADSFDTNPSSPTYYLGPFGDRATLLRGDFDTYATALAAADGELARKKGTSQVVQITGVPIAAHDEQDIIAIQRTVSDLDYTADYFILESATIPLGYQGTSSIRCVGRIL